MKARIYSFKKLLASVALAVLSLFLTRTAHAQTIDYSFTYLTDEIGYHDLVADTLISDSSFAWSCGAGSVNWEFPLGFDFHFFNDTISKLYLLRGTPNMLVTTPEPDSSLDGPNNILSPIGMNVFDRAWYPYYHYVPGLLYDSTSPGFAPLSPITYKVEGTAPHRTAKIQYKNVGFQSDTTGTAFINYQVWLYEGSDVIEFRYGPQNITTTMWGNDSVVGTIVCLYNDKDLGSCGATGRQFLVQGPGETPSCHPYGIDSTAPSYSPGYPWPFVQGAPPNRMIYRFAPYTNTTVDTPVTPESVQATASATRFLVTPNPAHNIIHIKHDGVNKGIALLSDATGRTMWRKELLNLDDADISGLPAGAYMLRIIAPGYKTFTTKLIKE